MVKTVEAGPGIGDVKMASGFLLLINVSNSASEILLAQFVLAGRMIGALHWAVTCTALQVVALGWRYGSKL